MRLRQIGKTKAIGIMVAVIGLAAVLIVTPFVQAANTVPGNNTLISYSDVSGQDTDRDSQPLAITPDGNKVLFMSAATNIGGSTNTTGQGVVYMRNVSAGTTVRVDVSTAGVPANSYYCGAAMSKTGRYVAFCSRGTNLIDGTTTPIMQTYLRDMQLGTTTLISTNSSGTPSPVTVGPVAVSDDGRYVLANTNNAQALVDGSIRTGYSDPVLLDRTTNTWSLVATPVSGSLQNVNTSATAMNCDGSLIMLQSSATNLVSGFSGSGTHVYLADVRRSTTLTDLSAGATLDSTKGSISCNGDFVAFATKDRTLISPNPSTINSNYHIIRYDRITGQKGFVDTASDGTTFSSQEFTNSSISDKGDMVFMFSTYSSYYNRHTPTVNLKHLSDGSGTLENVFKTSTGGTFDLYNEYLGYPQVITANGKYVVYSTRKAYYLGLLNSPYHGTDPYNIVRSETGLQ